MRDPLFGFPDPVSLGEVGSPIQSLEPEDRRGEGRLQQVCSGQSPAQAGLTGAARKPLGGSSLVLDPSLCPSSEASWLSQSLTVEASGMPVRPHHPRACSHIRIHRPAPCPALCFLNDPARLPHASLPLSSSPSARKASAFVGALLLIQQNPAGGCPIPLPPQVLLGPSGPGWFHSLLILGAECSRAWAWQPAGAP